MSVFSQRIPSNVAFPLSAQSNNILTFSSQGSAAPVNHALSYIELQMSLEGLGDQGYKNVTFGRNGDFYTPSAIIRNSSLVEPTTSKTHCNLQFVNVLNQTLNHYDIGSASTVAGGVLASGAGHADPRTGEVVSTFNNNYPEENGRVMIRIPVSECFPGDVGSSELYSIGNDSTYGFLLENQYKFLQRSYPPAAPLETITLLTPAVDFGQVGAGLTAIPAGVTGIMGNYSVNDTIFIASTIAGTKSIAQRKVTAIIPDAGSSPGSLVFATPLSATNSATANKVLEYTDPNVSTSLIKAEPIAVTTNTLKLSTALARNKSLSVGTVCNVRYTLTDLNTLPGTTKEVVQRKITALTPSLTGDITDVQFDSTLVVPADKYIVNIFIEALYQNLDSVVWKIEDAHLVLYHSNMMLKTPKKMVVSNFESSSVQMLGNSTKFLYNFQIRNSAFNTYVMLNDGDSLFSQAMGIDNYMISCNEVPLTSVFMPLGSSLHQDNVIRVLDNSPNFKPNVLVSKKNFEVVESVAVAMVPGKIFRSEVDKEPNMPTPGMPNNLRVELNPTTVTVQGTVFVFSEKYEQL